MFTAQEKIILRHRNGFRNGQPVYVEKEAAATVIEAETRKKNGITADGSTFIIAPPAEAAAGDIIRRRNTEYHIEKIQLCRDIDGVIRGIKCTALK